MFGRRRSRALVGLAVALAAAGIAMSLFSSPHLTRLAGVAGFTDSQPASTSAAVAGAPLSACPWLNPSLSVATRVDLLLKAMTPAEEANLLHLYNINLSVRYEGWTPAIPALCLPMITEQDGSAGVGTSAVAVTQVPAPISDAAAFDPALAGQYGQVIGAEDAAKGIDMALAPTINIDRTSLWGRSYETLGEDPYLSAALSFPLVRGIQANRVVAVVKHFAVYNQELHRGTPLDNSVVTDRAIHEVYLPAFRSAVEQGGAGSVMCSYNLINGTPACQDASLIDGVLRQQWHFTGFVRSDCGSIYDQTAAMAAGISQVKCSRLYNPSQLATAVETGRMPRAALDALARPLLTVLFRFDLIARPHPSDLSAIATSAAHRAVALATADEGSVLLQNRGALLPLQVSRLRSLALIGPDGGTPMPAGFGAAHVLPTGSVTASAALRQLLGSRLRYADGTNVGQAAALAKQSQVAVVVVHDVESERVDRTSLSLPPPQDALVEAVAAANPHTIVVLETGAAVLMPWLSRVSAVLETWYPGQVAGTSLVDLLTGRVDPSGKLPVTFPASDVQMPAGSAGTFGGVKGQTLYSEGLDVGYRWYEQRGLRPAFSFGFGLSYTRFGFSGLSVRPGPAGSFRVTATITNTGGLAGGDVVQCYVGDPAATGEPARQLRGFTRVNLRPGRPATVSFTLTPGDLAVWDTASGSWVQPAGTYRIWVGDGSDLTSLPLSTTVAVKATTSLGADSGPAAA
jgi:beta-glucosidase